MRRRDKEPPIKRNRRDRPHYRWALVNAMLTWPYNKRRLPSTSELFILAPLYQYVSLKQYEDIYDEDEIDPEFFPIRWAEELYEDTTSNADRWLIEAYFCAGLAQEQISYLLDIPLNVVIVYEKAFFDVSLYIHDPVIFDRKVMKYAKETMHDGHSKYVARKYGQKIYEYLSMGLHGHDGDIQHEAAEICLSAYAQDRNRGLMGFKRLKEGQLETALLNMKEKALEIAAARSDTPIEGGRLMTGASDAANVMVQAMAKAGKQLTQREIEKRAGEGTTKFVKSQQMSADKHALANMVTTLKNQQRTRDKE
jgi:hypothetical protein